MKNPDGAQPGLQLPTEARKIFRKREEATPFAVIAENNQEPDRLRRETFEDISTLVNRKRVLATPEKQSAFDAPHLQDVLTTANSLKRSRAGLFPTKF